MVFIGEFIASYIFCALIINLCTMSKLKKLEGEARSSFIKKRRMITIIVAIVFLLLIGLILPNMAAAKYN